MEVCNQLFSAAFENCLEKAYYASAYALRQSTQRGWQLGRNVRQPRDGQSVVWLPLAEKPLTTGKMRTTVDAFLLLSKALG